MKYSTLILAAGLVFSGSVSAQDLEQMAVKHPTLVQTEARAASFTPLKTGVSEPVKKVITSSKTVRFGMSRAASAQAYYTQPDGLFSYGIDEKGSGIATGIDYRFGGAYCDYTFTNQSQNATSYEWSYKDDATGDEFTSNAVNLSVNLPLGTSITSPVLKANGEGGSSTYVYPNENASVYFRGAATTQILFSGSDAPTTLGITTYGGNWNKNAGWSWGSIFAYPLEEQANSIWKQTFGADSVRMVGFANVFDKPLQPYYITKMWSWFNVKNSKPVSLLCTIYKAAYDENGYLVKGDVIAEGETVVSANPQGSSIIVTFPLYIINEDGDPVEGTPIIINDEIIVEVSGFDGADGLDLLAPVWGTGNYAYSQDGTTYLTAPTHAFFDVEAMANNGQSATLLSEQPVLYYGDEAMTYMIQTSDLTYMLDAVFPFCSVNEKVVNLPVSGGEGVLEANCYWRIGTDENSACVLAYADENQNADWLEVSISSENGVQYLTFSADACTDPEGRKVELALYGLAMNPVYFTVNQGAKISIDGVEADKDVKAVEFYDVMGRKLNAQPENGMFIRKAVMTDGSVKTAKVAK